MSATSAIPSAAWFVKELTKAHVFEPAQLSPYISEFKATLRGGANAQILADFLVKSGLLTRYQADRCLAGDADKLILGPYFLTRLIGSGSIGDVYHAIGRSDRKRYAVKVLPLRNLWIVQEAKKRLLDFAAIPDHPAIVPFVNIDSAGGSHYLAWYYVEGQTLKSRVIEKGPATIPAAIRVMTQSAEGLAVCHDHGFAHGLINPSNLMIGKDGQIRILDLGIGAILTENIADEESIIDTMAATNTALGMIDCCAPETHSSPLLREPAGDLYSLGCTYFFLLTGRMPYPDGNLVNKVYAHQTFPIPSVREWNPNVPDWMDQLVQRLMAKSPADRPAHLSEFLNELKARSSEQSQELPAHTTENLSDADGDQPSSVPNEDTQVRSQQTATCTASDATNPEFTPAEAGRSETGHDDPADPLKKPERPVERSKAETLWGLPPIDPTLKPPAPQPFHPIKPSKSPSEASLFLSQKKPKNPKANPPRQGWIKSLFHREQKRESYRMQCSVFGPSQLKLGQSVRLKVFVHRPESFDSVCTLSKVFHTDSILLSTNHLDQPVKLEAIIDVKLKVTNAGVTNADETHSESSFPWQGQSKPREFDVYVSWDFTEAMTTATLLVEINGALLGEFPFQIPVMPRR